MQPNPSPPPPGPTSAFLITLGILGTALLLIVGVAFINWGTPSPPLQPSPLVRIESYGIAWSSGPPSFCGAWSESLRPTPFTLPPSTEFVLPFQLACYNTTGSYTIVSIDSVTNGFSFVSAGLPITITGTVPAALNVTLISPSSSYDGPVTVWATAVAG